MKLLRIKAVARKEFLQISRDRLSLAMAFLMPVILLIIFGYAITFDVDRITTIIYDRDRSALSRELVDELKASGYFTVQAHINRLEEIDPWLDSGRARVAILIPDHFSKDVETRASVQVGVIIDGSDSNTATIAEGYMAAVAQTYSQRIKAQRVRPLIEIQSRVWYNPELRSKNFIIPGLIAVIMSVIVALLTSLTVAREWERGTMEQLISTPVKTGELILGKLLPYFAIGFIDMIVSVLMAVFLFGVPVKGNILLLFLLSGIFLFGGVSLGVLISIQARGSQMLASQIAMLATFLPAFLLSGFMFAISNMPKPLQVITYLLPARYFVSILKGIFLKASSLRMLWLEALLLSVFSAAVFMLANRKFRKRME